MNPEPAYECASCPSVFEDFEEAANCCSYGYHDIFTCGACRTDYATEREAEQCCQEEQNDH